MNAQIFKENFLILRLWWRKMRGLALNELAPFGQIKVKRETRGMESTHRTEVTETTRLA